MVTFGDFEPLTGRPSVISHFYSQVHSTHRAAYQRAESEIKREQNTPTDTTIGTSKQKNES